MTEKKIDWSKGIVYQGNQRRIRELMNRCKQGEDLTIGFLGGSITQGSVASESTLCYAYRTFQWFQNSFHEAKFTYVNAGIGGTTSHFGAGRADSDLLSFAPDFVIVEFSVNDENTEHFLETYEGLIRKIYQSKSKPAMLLVHNMYYDTGVSAQDIHERIGRHYRIPCVSMKPTIYQAVADGTIDKSNISPDNLHPNDAGHELLATQIIYFLDSIMKSGDIPREFSEFPSPLTKNRYENTCRYQNQNCKPELDGFVVDRSRQKNITDCFKNGWIAEKTGNSIVFHVTGRTIAVQYRRAVNKPAPVAEVLIDGNVVTRLDANFDEDWGDKLALSTVLEEDTPGHHIVEVRIVEAAGKLATPFYLTALLVS